MWEEVSGPRAAVFYGTVSAAPDERATLESFGLQLGEFSAQHGWFYACGDAAAVAQLGAFDRSFPATMLQRENPSGAEYSFLDVDRLRAELAYLDYSIHSPEARGERKAELQAQRAAVLDELQYQGEPVQVSGSEYVRGALVVAAHRSSDYAPRTFHNAKAADATVAFAVDFASKGEILTKKAAEGRYLAVPLDLKREPEEAARLVFEHLKRLDARSLNVAGNSIKTLAKHGVTQQAANRWVFQVLEKVHEHRRIERVHCGGQTGVDLAGAVAGVALGIETHVMMPAGFKQRGIDGKDRNSSQAEVESAIHKQVAALSASPESPPSDEPWLTPPVEVAHLLLRERVPGAAFDGEPFMGTSTFTRDGQRFISCDCYFHTVLYHSSDRVAVFTRDEGGMVPWVDGLPDMDFLVKRIRLPDGAFERLWTRNKEHEAAACRDAVVKRMPEVVRRWVAEGSVRLVPPESAELSPEIVAHFRERGDDKITGVTFLKEGQQVVLAFSGRGARDEPTVRHEAIHVAQIWAGTDVMEQALHAAARRGEAIAGAVAASGGLPPQREDELWWIPSAMRRAYQDGRDGALGALKLAMMIYPRQGVSGVAKELGFSDREGVVAALCAHYLLETGFSDWQSDIARELVAYTFQSHSDPVVDALLESADGRRPMPVLGQVRVEGPGDAMCA
ncbi:putative molybdenum carrier protein [Ralstonia sp. ASV6]|uniref:YpsA SLOG family protein n=1 Tax=Ralstonia sp. ASV6 TaxID=2795124 RepID=UPI0018EDB071|nr:putative molybdenum carrier protein [Ralstonia sp. ASV6]